MYYFGIGLWFSPHDFAWKRNTAVNSETARNLRQKMWPIGDKVATNLSFACQIARWGIDKGFYRFFISRLGADIFWLKLARHLLTQMNVKIRITIKIPWQKK